MLQCVHWLRALRWGSLLSGLERVRFRALNASTAVGNMLLVLLPLRLGEFARPVLISRRSSDCSGETGSCTPLRLDAFQSFVVLGVTVLGGMIPAAPGMAGTFQAGVRVSLSLFVPPAVLTGTGLAFANVMWLATVLHQVGLGLLTLARGTVSLDEMLSTTTPPPPESPAGAPR
jgi:uncharacterized membrane protein YbhN (UPF0104 family)